MGALEQLYDLIHSRDVVKSEQAWANDYFTNLACPDGRSFVVPNSPVKFFGIDVPATRHPDPIGAQTSAVLSECGYSADEIKALFDCGAAAGK